MCCVFGCSLAPANLCQGTTTSAQQLRNSTVAARLAQSVTVASSRVTCECRSPGLRSPPLKIQARKKSTKINFLGPETARWGGGLPCEGVVAEKFVPSLESLSCLGFEERNLGCPGNFAGMSLTLGVFKKFAPKKFARIFRSLKMPDKCGLEVGPLSFLRGWGGRAGIPVSP